MNILIVSSYLPFPLLSGGQVRLYNVIKELSAKHTITLVCEIRESQGDTDVQEVKKYCKNVYTVPRKKQWSPTTIGKAGFSFHSFLVTGHTSKRMRTIIDTIITQEHFDLIHIETFYVMQNLPHVSLPVVLCEHNIEYTVYQKFAQRMNPLVRPLLAIDIAKIQREEQRAWRVADAVIAVSREDASLMQQDGVIASIIPNGVNTAQFVMKDVAKQKDSKEKKILFIGDFRWMQNTDAVTYILTEIFPQLKESPVFQKNNITLWIVGRHIPESIRALSSDPAILFDEASSQLDAPEIFSSASVLLAPIRVGGGTSYKILESMSCGTPVVTMPMSAHAIGATHKESIMIGKNAEELAKDVLSLISSPLLYETVAKNGRHLIEKKYTWQMIATELDALYQKVVQ